MSSPPISDSLAVRLRVASCIYFSAPRIVFAFSVPATSGYGCRVLANVFSDVLRSCAVCLNMRDSAICVFGIREVARVLGEALITVLAGLVLSVFVVALSEGFQESFGISANKRSSLCVLS